MSFSTTDIVTLAASIYDNLNSPPSLSVGYISGSLTSSGMLGELNGRLTTDFWISGGAAIVGDFGAQESAIYALMFETNYYRRKALEALQCGSTWTTIREGDSSISRDSSIKASTEYRALRKESEGDLHVAVANWKIGKTMPVEVRAEQMASYPTP